MSGAPTDLAGNALATGSIGSFAVKIFVGSLSITAQPPSAVVAGVAFPLTVEATDPQGHVISNFNEDVTLSVASSQGQGTLYGTVTVAAIAGVATFTDVSLEQAGSGYTITAAYAGLTSATSNSISVTAAPATKLSIASQPTTSVTGNTEFEVDVSAVDPYGNVDQTFTQPLTIGILTGPTGAVLGGTKTESAVDGVAAFANLTLATAYTGYTLRATGSNGFAATTTPFTVTPAAALAFAVSAESVDETTGSAMIEVDRASGYPGAVSVDIGTSGGTAVAGTNYTAVNNDAELPWRARTAKRSVSRFLTPDSFPT